MAYEPPILKWSDDRGDDDENGRTYNAGWTVVADSLADAFDAMASIGVVPGSDASTVYPDIPCKSRSPSRLGSSNLYGVTATFQGAADNDGSLTPDLKRPTVEWIRGSETVPIDRDAYGNAITNSALDPIEGIAIERQRLFMRITKWEVKFDARKAVTYENTCNDDVIRIVGYDFQPGEVALMEYMPTGKIEYTLGGEQVPHQVEVYYLLEFRASRKDFNGDEFNDGDIRTGFYIRQLDAGVQGWYTDDGGTDRLGSIETKVTEGYQPVSQPVRLAGGFPVDHSFFVAGKDDTNWTSPIPQTAAVVDDSNPDADFLLYPLKEPVDYAHLLDDTYGAPVAFVLS